MDTKKRGKRTRGSGGVFLRGDVWWYCFTRDGETYRESAETTTKTAAQAKLAKRIRDVEDGFTRSKIGVADLIESAFRHYETEGYTSLQDARERWEKHLKPVFGAVRASQVTTDKLEAYKDARLTTKAAKATINRELALLRLAFNLGRKARKLQFVPHFPMYRENNTRKGFLEDAQYDKLATACAKRGLWLRAMFETAVQLGWRSGELKGMLVQQADIAAKTLRLEPGTTKNRDGRTAVMPATLAMLIQQCATGKKAGDFLFTRDGGQPIKDFRGAWEEATKEAGVPDLLFHDLRRTAVRNMVRRGIAERVAMGITGHRTRSVFDRYHIVSGSDLREAAEKMSQPIPSLTIDSQSNGEGRNILPN